MSEYEDEFEYESDAGMSESDSNEERANENLFYDAEDLRNSNPTKSLDMFRSLTNSPSCGSAWKFKALVQVINLGARLGRNASISRDLDDLFNVIDGVPRNEAVDGLSCVVDSIGSFPSNSSEQIIPAYTLLLQRLTSTPYLHSLRFNVSLRLARELLESRSDTSDLELSQLLHDMRASCLNAEGNEDVVNKGAQLLDVYSIEIQRLNSFRTRDGVKRMKQIMTKCALASSAVSNPRSMGIIRENAGKILMDDGWYDDAYNEFFESFKAYADTGNARARSVLKYAVVANILSLSTINPFDSREAKAFLNDPEIMMILKLRQAFDQRDLGALDTILKGSSFSMKNDSWLEPHLGELIYRIKLKFLELLVGVHRRVRLVKLAGRLGVDTKTISRMLMRLFLDQKVPNLSLDDEYCHLHFNESGGIEAIVRSSCQLMVATQGLNEKLDTVRNKH